MTIEGLTMVRAYTISTSVKFFVSLATCITLFLSDEYAIRAFPSSSCAKKVATSVMAHNIGMRAVVQGRITNQQAVMRHTKADVRLQETREGFQRIQLEMKAQCKQADLEDGEVSAHVPVRSEAVHIDEWTCMQT